MTSSFSQFLLSGSVFKSINELNDNVRRAQRRALRKRGQLESRVYELEHDVGYLSLLMAALLAKLDESGTLSRGDLKLMMEELDDFDGVKNGRLDVSILRGATGEDPASDPASYPTSGT